MAFLFYLVFVQSNYSFQGSRFILVPLPLCYCFKGHSNGAIQMWDLTTALDFFNKNEKSEQQIQAMATVNRTDINPEPGGPTTQELVILI